ncbi:hypothetical protein C8A05DRAFT_18949 [Staphylotrichum tortipilum]|uniref:Small ribosomal subunit protein uS5m n=1 Tax=Staphylotrichum tortipilum TaxID=2831512 RepID=A0AAN6MEI8_9PEZI|nr:hypothetical protein C8A05DRAFT_18949 [Staphylotrichum longicolle]
MSAARPAARRLISGRLASGGLRGAAAAVALPTASSTTTTTTTTTTTPCHQLLFAHQFHSSPQLAARRRPRFPNVRAVDMGLIEEEKVEEYTKETFPKYTEGEMKSLRKRYSEKQMAAIEAGEDAIEPRDLTMQGRLRIDPYRMPYIDDFAENQPIIDKRLRRQKDAPDPHARFMNMDEFADDLIDWADKLATGDVTGTLKTLVDFVPDQWKKKPESQWPREVQADARKAFNTYLEGEVARQAEETKAEKAGGLTGAELRSGPTDGDILKYILERSTMTDGNRTSDSSLAHALPSKVPGVAGLYKTATDLEDAGLDDLGVYQDLKRRSGMTVREIFRVDAKMLVSRRVSNQTRLGKVSKLSVMYVAGNGGGWLGLGEAKSTEETTAMEKAKLLALRNMQPIRRYEDRTIYGSVEAKVSGTIVRLASRPPGFGLRVSHRIFEMARAAGLKDLSATIPRSRNPMNSVRAAYKALLSQPDPEEMALGRGKKLVDARKVYYGGATQ